MQGDFAYSFMVGVLAAVNPCGFVLLPTWLLYFLGIEGDVRRAPVSRALAVSAAMSAGLVGVFLVVGLVTRLFTQSIAANAQWLGFAVGVALVLAGTAMLAGWKPYLAVPGLSPRRDRSLLGVAAFGAAYAVASIGCTIGLLTSAVMGGVTRHGFLPGVIGVVLYGLGMSLLVTALTVALALARQGMVRVLRAGMRHANRLAGVALVASGLYLCWYWYGSIDPSAATGGGAVSSWQSSLAGFLQSQGAWRLAAAFALVIGLPVAWSLLRTRAGAAAAPDA